MKEKIKIIIERINNGWIVSIVNYSIYSGITPSEYFLTLKEVFKHLESIELRYD